MKKASLPRKGDDCLVHIVLAVTAPARLTAMLAEQSAGGGIEQPDVVVISLDGDGLAEPPGRRRLVRAGHFDAAIEMYRAGTVFVVAKGLYGQRPELRLLFSGHGGDLALPGAEDALDEPRGGGLA